MAEDKKDDTQHLDGQDGSDNGSDGKGGEPKVYTQEDIDKMITERLKREQKKFDAKLKELEEKSKASDGKEVDKSELEKMQETISDMSKQLDAQKKETERERFEKQITKYANKFEVDVDKALKYLDPSKIEVDDEGNMDFEKTFAEFAELAGKKKKDGDGGVGEPPKPKPKFTKSYKDATVEERKAYLDAYGTNAFSEWVGKSKK